MDLNTEFPESALLEFNSQSMLRFSAFKPDFNIFDTAVAVYRGIILRLIFLNDPLGQTKFQLLRTEIDSPGSGDYFENRAGSSLLTISEAAKLLNVYLFIQEKLPEPICRIKDFKGRPPKLRIRGGR